MLNSENCETSYEEIQRMRRAKKRAEFKAQVKHYAKIGFYIALPFIIIGLLVGLIGYKDSTEVVVKQSLFGKMSCVEIGEHEGDSVMVTMFPNGQYWITNFAKLNDGSVVTMGQRITYSESEMLKFLKRVKTFLESGDGTRKLIPEKKALTLLKKPVSERVYVAK